MPELRTVIFIDGRNFRYNLRAFRFHADPNPKRFYRLDEKHFLWRQFFVDVLRKFDSATTLTHRLVRVYWYSPESMRPFEVTDRLVQKVVDSYGEEFPDLTHEKTVAVAKEWYEEERRHFDQTRERVFENIQRKVDFLEFKYVGEYVVRPFAVYRLERKDDGSLLYRGTREGEKGVDVGISVDMMSKMPNYDVAVLVSGDADFIPVVRYLKDGLKQVYQFSLAQGIPPRITYLSPWLIGRVDCFQAYDELELLSTYLDRRSGIPAAVLVAIDERTKYLEGIARTTRP